MYRKCYLNNKKTSHQNKVKADRFRTISIIQAELKIWRMRNVTLKEKIVISKTLALSEIMFQLLIIIVPYHIISELISIQKKKKNYMEKIKSKNKARNFM